MSSILDALKKSERLRLLGRAPVYRDASLPAGVKLMRWTSLLAGVILLLALVSTAMQILGQRESVAAPEPGEAPTSRPANRQAATDGSETKPDATARTPARDVEGYTQPATQASRVRQELAEQARTERPETAPSPPEDDAPWLSDLPASFRASLPPLAVNIHVYAPDESQRILYLNNHPYRRGDWIPGGVSVEEIVEDGVILRCRGQRFKLPRPSY